MSYSKKHQFLMLLKYYTAEHFHQIKLTIAKSEQTNTLSKSTIEPLEKGVKYVQS